MSKNENPKKLSNKKTNNFTTHVKNFFTIYFAFLLHYVDLYIFKFHYVLHIFI